MLSNMLLFLTLRLKVRHLKSRDVWSFNSVEGFWLTRACCCITLYHNIYIRKN